ncbi:hypothetical protein D3C72_1652930 [compost metagenome]
MRYAHHPRTRGGKLRRRLGKGMGLHRAALCERLGKEVQHHRPALERSGHVKRLRLARQGRLRGKYGRRGPHRQRGMCRCSQPQHAGCGKHC